MSALLGDLDALKKDAARYRWLRAQTWDASGMAVVVDPKTAVRLGHDCPSLDRLDAAIDAGIECATHGHRLEQAGPKFPGLSVCTRCGYRDRRKSA